MGITFDSVEWSEGQTVKIVKPSGTFFDVVAKVTKEFIITEKEFVYRKSTRLRHGGDRLDGYICPMTRADKIALHKMMLIRDIKRTKLTTLSVKSLKSIRKFLRSQKK